MVSRSRSTNVNFFRNRRAQLTLFIIIAILIVLVVVLFFVFRGKGVNSDVPRDFQEIYSYYLSCIQDETKSGADLLGRQGGYIELPTFIPGSSYMPFSSQLNFLGSGVPYWYYVSGNGVIKEQKPTISKMESELNKYLKEEVANCDFSNFEGAGYSIFFSEPKSVLTKIEDSAINVKVNQEITFIYGDQAWSGSTHTINADSKLKKFYELSEKIYNKHKNEMFLENYGVDILRLYAPVDGTELSCSSKIWQVDKIRDDLMTSLEGNTMAIKVKGDYYKLSNKEHKYFVIDVGEDSDVNVNFMYSRYWPMKLEVWPSENGILKADPVGLTEGMGILGFCYVPYHFVYDLGYPVMIQLYSGNEFFQFPVVVSIVKNKPREALNVEGMPQVVSELCEHKNSTLTVYTYDNSLSPVEADISFKCFDTLCDIGQTKVSGSDAVFSGLIPQCVNGYIVSRAKGYETETYMVTSISDTQANIVMKKKYKLNLEISKDGTKTDEMSIISFIRNSSTISLSYPEQKEVELSEGPYTIKVYVYSNSSIRLSGSSSPKCVDVPKGGILGIVGITEKKCFNMNVPDQIVSNVVSGGGIQNWYFGEDELMRAKKIIVDANNFGIPQKLEDLQFNYNNVDNSKLNIILKEENE